MPTSRQTPRMRVLMIGPTAPAVGGMVSVMETLAASPLREHARISIFPNNQPWGRRWGLPGALFRHVSLLVLLTWRILRERIDLVHIHTCSFFSFFRNIVDLALLHVLRRTVILHVHGCYFDRFYEHSGRLGRAVIRLGLERADAVIVLTDRWREWTRAIAPKAQVRVIRNGVRVGSPTPSHTARPRVPCRFLYMALMDESKGLFDLLAAAAQLKSESVPFELVLAGPWNSAQDEKRFRAFLERDDLHGCVEYVGVADNEQREGLLGDADVFVLPSHEEAMPMSILEAMSRALPVIGTDVGAVAECVADGVGGLVVKSGEAAALADAMKKLAGEPALRAAMGCEARLRIARRFSDVVQARAVLELYHSLRSLRPAPSEVQGAGMIQQQIPGH